MTGSGALGPDEAARLVKGTISTALHQRLHDPVLLLSVWLRTALGLGIVFVMSIKPGVAGTLTAMGVALGLGLVAGFPAWSRSAGRRRFDRTRWNHEATRPGRAQLVTLV